MFITYYRWILLKFLVKIMDFKHQKYELNENMSEDELIRNLKVNIFACNYVNRVYK